MQFGDPPRTLFSHLMKPEAQLALPGMAWMPDAATLVDTLNRGPRSCTARRAEQSPGLEP
jgi:hypothetical protein